MNRYIVSWWDGDELVSARNEREAKAIVARTSVRYRHGGRGAPLFVERVEEEVA